MEQNYAAPGQPIAQKDGTEAMPGDMNFTLDSEFLGSNFIAIGGIPFFLFDLSKWMLRKA